MASPGSSWFDLCLWGWPGGPQLGSPPAFAAPSTHKDGAAMYGRCVYVYTPAPHLTLGSSAVSTFTIAAPLEPAGRGLRKSFPPSPSASKRGWVCDERSFRGPSAALGERRRGRGARRRRGLSEGPTGGTQLGCPWLPPPSQLLR